MSILGSLIGRAAGITAIGCTGIVVGPMIPVQAQDESTRAPAVAAGDWPLHNLDLANSRYSPLDQITRANAGRLALQWTFSLPEPGDRSSTPVVVDGVMYFNAGATLYALDAATGQSRWTLEVPQEDIVIGGRGPLYAEGRIYATGRSHIYAVDATSGKLVTSFGDRGVLNILQRAVAFKDPGKYPPDFDPESIGYRIASPPTSADGVLYIGLAQSDSLAPGGLVVALEAATGRIQWVFRTVPQGPQDDGWAIAAETWSRPERYGGGIWTQPAIDPALGLLYVNVANPSPNYDGSSRKGINLFTNAIVALELATGKLKWSQQVIHHDIWDWDLATGPTLFDVTVNGQIVHGLASLAKTCYIYALNRETGKPIFPLVETAVPTATDVPGEAVWPTQPIPYTARRVPQTPFCAIYPPTMDDPELAARRRPSFTPYRTNEFIIQSPGLQGGPNYGNGSFSPRTGWLYVSGKNDAWSVKVKPVGASLSPGRGSPGHYQNIIEVGPTEVTATQNVAAYDPATGELAWVTEVPGRTSGGNLVTAGDVVFQAVADQFYTFDARSGRQLSTIAMPAALASSPLSYLAQGRQYVAIAGGRTVLAFGLP